jgi:hypothetical protein
VRSGCDVRDGKADWWAHIGGGRRYNGDPRGSV